MQHRASIVCLSPKPSYRLIAVWMLINMSHSVQLPRSFEGTRQTGSVHCRNCRRSRHRIPHRTLCLHGTRVARRSFRRAKTSISALRRRPRVRTTELIKLVSHREGRKREGWEGGAGRLGRGHKASHAWCAYCCMICLPSYLFGIWTLGYAVTPVQLDVCISIRKY